MPDDEKDLARNPLHDLLLAHKYLSALQKITNGVTHQYNNIFTGLSGQLRRRKQDPDDELVGAKRTEMIEDLLRRGMEQTEVLYDFSRHGESCVRAYAPQRLAAKAIDLLNTVSRLHRFSLQSEENLPKILVRQRDMVLMLFYLGENALAAMKQGGEIRLEISLQGSVQDKGSVRFCLVDTGCGFADTAPSSLDESFPFIREATTLTGLGLYAVRTIVAEHGGIFTVAKRAGGGTRATVDIPVMASGRFNGSKASDTTRAVSVGRSQKHVFLVVDDEEAMRDVLCQRLHRRNHVAFCVASCREAIAEFRLLADSVTVVLIDVGLGDTNGYECARQLRSLDDQVQIILMSGMECDQQELVEMRATFLKKPFPIEQLEQLVNYVSGKLCPPIVQER